MAPKKNVENDNKKKAAPKAKAKAKTVSVKKVVKSKEGKAELKETAFKAKIVGKKFMVTIGTEVIEKGFSTNEEKDEIKLKIKAVEEKPTQSNLDALKKWLKPKTEAKVTAKTAEVSKIKKDLKDSKKSGKVLKAEKDGVVDDIKTKLENGTASEDEISEMEKLIAKNKKVEAPKPQEAAPERAYKGEYRR